jgi:hypothetical protein
VAVDPIQITGLRELNKALKQVDADLPKQTRLALNEGAAIVADEARSKVPRRTGRAASTYRARSTRTAARVAIGGAKAKYVPWLDFGGRTGPDKSVHRQFIKSGRYLFPALERKRPEVLAKLEKAVVAVVEGAGLDVE